MLEINRIHCGDNCDLMMQLPRECIDLVVTSPPYDDLRTYGGHAWDFFGVAWNLRRVLKPGGVIVWVVADATKDGSETGTSMEQALHFKRIGLNLLDTMIWEKTGSGALGSQNCYAQNFEYVFVFSSATPNALNFISDRKNVITNGRVSVNGNLKPNKQSVSRIVERKEYGKRTNVWRIAPEQKTQHPAPFPFDLARDHIATWSNPGNLILDPFMGSGTTAKAAKSLNRNFIGIEINPDYCAIAEQRIAQDVLDLSA